VLFLTMHEDESLLHEALRAGAAGYVIKRAEESEIIRRSTWPVVATSTCTPDDPRAPSAAHHDGAPPRVAGGRADRRELEVLRLLARKYQRQIAELLASRSAPSRTTVPT